MFVMNNRIKIGLTLIFLAAILLVFNDCDTNEPPIPPEGEKPTLELTLEDVSCIEAWIKLTTTNLQLPATLTLKQINPTGDSLSQNFILNTQDTLLYVDSLFPNQTYKFHTTIQSSSHTSNELSVTTMDTTSHNFTFETFTFGGTAGSSVLYDVAIINENNIWAVGEIYVADTSQNGYTMYNAVHWDGNSWNLLQIMFYTICGQQNRTAYPASSLFAFFEKDIWIAMKGDQIARIENNVQTETRCLPWSFTISKIWGSSSSDMYVVGNNGNIIHYNGTLWSRIESGTDLNINDIWGDYNDKTGEWEILAVASNILQSNEKEVLRIHTTTTQIINKEGITGTLASVWFKSNSKYYVAGGGGVYENYSKGNVNWQKSNYSFIRNFLFRLRGTELNDIAGAGGYGDVLHFNGVSWKSYFNDTQLNYGNYYSIAIKGNFIIAVGQDNPQAVITIGRR